MITVAAYIPVRNGVRYIAECVKGLRSQTHPFSEILIVDDASDDGLQDWVFAQSIPEIRYIRIPVHKGLAHARNEAVRATSCDFIAAIDVDCVISPTWLSCLLPFLNDSTVAGVGGALYELESPRLPDRWRKTYLPQTRGMQIMSVPFLPGCTTLFRRYALCAVSGYNEMYYLNHEDTDLGRKLTEAGWKLMYVPRAVAEHIKQDTWYSVMRSCWGFRHSIPIQTFKALVYDLLREAVKTCKLLLCDFVCFRWDYCCTLDLVYFFYQSRFSLRAFALKHNNFH